MESENQFGLKPLWCKPSGPQSSMMFAHVDICSSRWCWFPYSVVLVTLSFTIGNVQARPIRCIADFKKTGNRNAHFLDDNFNESEFDQHVGPLEVTGRVGGFYVDVLTKIANGAELPIEFYVQNEASRSTSSMLESFATSLTDYDCVFSGTYVRSSRLGDVDYLIPLVSYGHAVATTVPKKERPSMSWSSLWKFTEPFTPEVWGCMFLFFLGCGSVMWFLEGDSLGTGRLERGWRVAYQTFGSFTGGTQYEPTTVSGTMLASVFSFTVLLLVSAYTANLAAFLTVESVPVQAITSVESFRKLNKVVCAGGSSRDFVANNFPDIQLHANNFSDTQFQTSVEGMMDMVREGKCAGFILSDLLIKSYIRDLRACDFHIVGQTLSLGYYGIAWQRNAVNSSWSASVRAALDVQIARLFESGDMYALIDRHFPSNPARAAGCPEISDEALAESRSLDIADLAGVFLLSCVLVPFLIGAKLCGYWQQRGGRRSATAGLPEQSAEHSAQAEAHQSLMSLLSKNELLLQDIRQACNASTVHAV